MTQLPLETLALDLGEVLARRNKGAEVAGMLERYSGTHDDWRDYALFQDQCYARNLVSASGLLELLVICWRPGQVSPIHDHQGQRCWMAVLEGEMRETHFHSPVDGGVGLRRGKERVFRRGSVAFISDEIALHQIEPVAPAGGVTLHLYSRPIRECRIFDPGTGEVTWRGLAYHSIGGVPQSSSVC